VRSFGEETAKVAALAAMFLSYGVHARREKGADEFFLCGVFLWAGIGAAVAWRRWVQDRDRVATTVLWRVLVTSLAIATVTFFVGSFFDTRGRYACAHGTRWANSQVAIAWSDSGGPCGNGAYQRVGRPWRIATHLVHLPAARLVTFSRSMRRRDAHGTVGHVTCETPMPR
jgi:hypothetical protein